MNITIIGLGYVGLSLAVLLSQKHNVIALDIDGEKVNKIKNKISPIKDRHITEYLNKKDLNLVSTSKYDEAFSNCEFAIICTPTNYDSKNNKFDLKSVKFSIEEIIKYNSKCTIIVKSTVPIGFTDECQKNYSKNDIYFSPEFLREGSALYDNLFPSRIIVGGDDSRAREFGKIMHDLVNQQKDSTPLEFMSSFEAEAVKLFSNSYLAMRVAFFNELDSFCLNKNISAENIITGIGHDPRIGNYYNNPSFGYGGYCLPKDTKQLLQEYKDVPNSLIAAIIESNHIRKEIIIQNIIKKSPKIVGVYRLIMKHESDNFRNSAVKDIINSLDLEGIEIIIFEPSIDDQSFEGFKLENNLDIFLTNSDIILANRVSNELKNVSDKVFTRDIFNNN